MARSRLAREDGVALAIAMWTLLIVGTLSAMLLATASQSSRQAVSDRNAKAALTVADAGLQTAVYRLNQTSPTSTSNGMCFQTTWVSKPVGGYCPAQQESYGSGTNGGHFSYWVSPTLSQTDGCTGLWVSQGGLGPVDQRCVTATGTVNGVTRRVQERAVSYQPISTFPVNGIFSRGTLTFTNTTGVSGDIATNGAYAGGGSVFDVNGTVTSVPPNTIPNTITCSSGCVKNPNGTAFQILTPNTGPYTATSTSSTNNDAALCAESVWPAGTCNASTRTINVTGTLGSSTNPVVFQSGVYNFCSFRLGNTSYLTLAAGAQVRILIDSPATGDGCPTGTGDLNFTNSVDWTNPSNDPSTLEIDAYGNPSGTLSTFNLTNTVNTGDPPFYGRIYAPYSAIKFTNKANLAGSIVGGTVNFTNATGFFGADGGSQQVGDGDTYYPQAWHECPAAYSGDPASGCY